MDFGTAAQETVAKLNLLLEQVDSSQGELQDTRDRIQTVHAAIDHQADEVAQRAESLIEQAHQAQEQVTDEVQRVDQLFQTLQEQIHQAKEQLDADLSETKVAIALLSQQVDDQEPRLRGTAQTLEADLNDVKNKASIVRDAIKAVLDDIQDYLLQTLTSSIQASEADLNEASGQFNQHVTSDTLPTLADYLREFQDAMVLLRDRMDETLQTAQDKTEDAAQSTMDAIADHEQDCVADLSQTAENIEALMEQVGDLVETGSRTVSGVKDNLLMAVKATNLAARTAIGILNDILCILRV
jgi:ABC-type transporter Mla subunit MlaD